MQKPTAKKLAIRHQPIRAALFRAVLLLMIDRALKVTSSIYWSQNHIQLSGSFSLTHNLNRRLSFSLPGNGPLFNWLLIFLVIGLTIYSRQAIKKQPSRLNGWLFLLTGAYSNLYDRLIHGGVIDYLTSWWTVFNLADLLIGLGLIILIWPEANQNPSATPPVSGHSQQRPPEPLA